MGEICEVCGLPIDFTEWTCGNQSVCAGANLANCYRLGYERSQAALAAARRECEGLRDALRDLLAHAEWMDAHHHRFPNSAVLNARALIPPAAAGAADYDPITAPIPAGDMNGPHGPIRTVPMMPVNEAADARIDAIRAAQPRETSRPIAPDPFAGHSDTEVYAALDEVRGKGKAPAEEFARGADMVADAVVRIEELEALLRECESMIAACGQMAEQVGYVSTEQMCRALLAKLRARAAPPEREGK